MSDVSKTNEREKLALAIGEVLFNVSNYPKAAQAYLWGQNMAPLREKLVEAVTAALATRVPVQGEPNDDRGELRKLAEGGKAAKEKLYEIGTGVGGLAVNFPDLYEAYGQWGDLSAHDHADTVLMLLDELNAASRATVPDAATERERADLWRSLDWMLWGVGMNDVFREPLANKMIAALSDGEFDQAQDLIRGWDARRGGPHERNLFVELKAERDAALAAVERVRAIHEPFEAGGGRQYCGECSGAAGSGSLLPWPCSTIAALDGAPEPEWEYGLSTDGLDEKPEPFPTREAAQHVIDNPDIYRKWTHGNSMTLYYRRPTSAWLPVEGESRGK